MMLLYGLLNSYYVKFIDYSPGVWATILGSLLIITPPMCIPLFILVALYQVSETALYSYTVMGA